MDACELSRSQGGLHQRLHLSLVSNIAVLVMRNATRIANGLHDGAAIHVVGIGYHNPSAIPCRDLCSSCTDTSASTGDDKVHSADLHYCYLTTLCRKHRFHLNIVQDNFE